MRILFLSPRQCWPPDTGAKLREFHLARQLAKNAEVTTLAFAEDSIRRGIDFCRHIECVAPPKRYTALKLLKGLAGRTPVSVINYSTRPMADTLQTLLNRQQFDAVQIEGLVMAGYADLISSRPDAPAIVYDWHNIESELMSRYADQSDALPKRLYARVTARKLKSLEHRMLHTGSAHIVCSQREQAILRKIAPTASVVLVPNGVDTAAFAGCGAPDPDGHLVFVGSMDYHANIEGALHFSRNIWPQISREFPRAKLILVGSNPGAAIRSLAGIPQIEVTGTVPDIRPFYAQASVAIVPLLTGGGTRLKILEAMAAGVPVVSTPAGAEGLDLTPGRDFLLVKRDEEWIDAIRRLFTERALAPEIASRGRDIVRTRYDWDAAGETLTRLYRKLISERGEG
jgi:sugar transferase (PEP-CTERM/EpsH1 system associated)